MQVRGLDLSGAVDNARRVYENLNERERKLVAVLGGVVGLLVVLLPLYLMSTAISDLERQNREMVEVMDKISRARPMLRQREARQQAAQQRYAQKAPPLATFIEEKANAQGLQLQEVNPQPEKTLGEGDEQYLRRHARVNLTNVGLKQVVEMMAAIENSPYPVAIKRLDVEHYRSGDRYNIKLGVVAYDKQGGSGAGESGNTAEQNKGQVGPPNP
jgi:hypothetical protein